MKQQTLAPLSGFERYGKLFRLVATQSNLCLSNQPVAQRFLKSEFVWKAVPPQVAKSLPVTWRKAGLDRQCGPAPPCVDRL